MICALAAAILLGGPAHAASAPTLDAMPAARSAPGWTRQGSSLLLYGADGSLAEELPLREPDDAGAASRETEGGVSPDGNLAWTLDRRLAWTPDRARVLDSRRLLRVFGVAGAELWRDDEADLPERGDPVAFSADGRTLLVARRGADGWRAEARTWMGRPVGSVGPFPRLISLALTPNGRYVLARWAVPDQSDTHTFLDLKTGARRDVASSDLLLGLARIGDDGVARSGARTLFAFETAASSAAVAVSTPAAGGAR